MSERIHSIKTLVTKKSAASITRPANTTAYTAGDVLSGADDGHFVFVDSINPSAKTGEVIGATITLDVSQATPPNIDLVLFSADTADQADNGAVSFTDAEMATVVGVINFNDWFDGGNSMVQVASASIPFQLGGKNLYGQAVVQNAYTPTSGESFTVTLMVRQDKS
jgi:hypothetical protein